MFYGLESAEEVERLEWLPAPAQREPNKRYRKMQKMDDRTKVEVVVRTISGGNRGVTHKRACFKCGSISLARMATPGHVFCGRIECGGKKNEKTNYVRNEHRKAKRDANETALRALMAEYNVLRAPNNVNDAEYGKTYAKLNQKNGQDPHLVRRKSVGKSGSNYIAWCMCKNGGKTRAGQCNICVSKRPENKKRKLVAFCSECQNVLTPGYDICAGCRGKPDERVVAKIKKADIVMEAIAAELKSLGREELISKITQDCTKRDELTGICSGRRQDYDLNATPRFNINKEISEDQHRTSGYSDDCEKRKYTGQLMDRGAPGFTEAEGDLMDSKPTDEFLEDVAETDRDTPRYQSLRERRRRAVDRVLRDIRAREREIRRGDTSYVPMKMVVVHFNPDAFVDNNGIRQPGLFEEIPPEERDGSVRFVPLPTLFEAVKFYVAEIVRLHDRAQDEAWVDAQPSLAVSKYRYDGCRADGRPAKRRLTLFQ